MCLNEMSLTLFDFQDFGDFGDGIWWDLMGKI